MSGLLRNLGARALGTAPRLRSRASLPYEAAPSLREEAPASPALPAARAEEPSRPGADLVPVAELEGASARTVSAGREADARFEAQPPHPDDAPHPAQRVLPARAPRAEPPRASFPAALRAHGREHADERGSRAPALPMTLEPLLPTRPVAPTWHQPADVAPARPSADPLVDETTEVHVSIGRIEVTAVHEAPPRKRAAARAKTPMSLDEYLSRRERCS